MASADARLTRRQFLAAQAALIGSASFLRAGNADADRAFVLVPIVATNSRERDVSLGTLERVFGGKPVGGSDGTRFVPFNHPPKTRSRVLFDQRVLRMDPEEAARYWVDQRIRGGVRPPRTVPSVQLLKQVVRQFPGAISYVAVADLDDSVKALTVGGLRHDAPDYPIR